MRCESGAVYASRGNCGEAVEPMGTVSTGTNEMKRQAMNRQNDQKMSSRARTALRAAAVVAAVSLSGCSTPGEGPNDPLEPLNRTVYGVNYVADHVFLRPIAYAYRDGMPEPVQDGVRNALRNLKSPVIMVNEALQGKWDLAQTTLVRFLVNSTIGIVGLFDVAEGMGYPYHDEDFGQTLAVHGVGSGPYLVLPLIGPSNPRDTVGLAIDWLMDPFRLAAAAQNWDDAFMYTRTGASIIDSRVALLDPIDEIERSSLDTYVALRSMYRQRRAAVIRDGSADAAPGVEGSAFDFDEDGSKPAN